MPRGVLVLDHHGFGNVVMSVPFLAALSAESSGPVRVLFATSEHLELVREEQLRMEALFLDRTEGGLRGLLSLAKGLRGTVDLVVGVPQIPVPTVLAVRLAVGAPRAAAEGFRRWAPFLTVRAAKGWTRPVLEVQEELARRLGLATPLAPPRLTVTADERRAVAERVMGSAVGGRHPLIGLHAGASKQSKRWPPERFGRVLAALSERFPGAAVVSVGGSEDRASAEVARRATGLDVPWLEVAGDGGSIRETLAVLSCCDIFLSGDTGMMHMAAAVGVPTVSIFGATSARRLAPTWNGGRCGVPTAACHPCYRDRFRRCHCILEVTEQRVCDLAVEILTQGRA